MFAWCTVLGITKLLDAKVNFDSLDQPSDQISKITNCLVNSEIFSETAYNVDQPRSTGKYDNHYYKVPEFMLNVEKD